MNPLRKNDARNCGHTGARLVALSGCAQYQYLKDNPWIRPGSPQAMRRTQNITQSGSRASGHTWSRFTVTSSMGTRKFSRMEDPFSNWGR